MIEAIYEGIVRDLPVDLRTAARELPRWIGVSERPGGWSDYARLPPVIDLPSFAAQPLEVPPGLLEAARRAHVTGGFVGLALDRMADGQADGDAPLEPVVEALKHRWVSALAEVMGDADEAARAVEEGVSALARAATAESAAWTRASLSLDAYVQLVDLKTAWFHLASAALLRRCQGQGDGRLDNPRLAAFEASARLLMRSLQAFDDAEDEDEDRALRGVSVPEALGTSRRAMLLASVALAERGAERAASGGFETLAVWLRQRARDVHTNLSGRGDPLAGFVAFALSQS